MNNKKNKPAIFISGGGDIPQTVEIDKEYFAALPQSAHILYIPTALNTATFGADRLKQWFNSLIQTYLPTASFIMLEDDSQAINLNHFDSIYIGGGNTYKLLAYLLANGYDKAITRFIEDGKIVYGGSAGAIILGQDIRTVPEENDRNYPMHKGLGLIGNFAIICHYDELTKPNLVKRSIELGYPIIALPENAGLQLSASGDILKEYGSVYYFDR